jgi:hypothetical protein
MSEHPLKRALSKQPQLSVWLTYLWQRREEAKRLGLVLGAGVTRDAGCPMWRELVRRLSKAFELSQHRMKRHRDAGLSETFIAEVVFRHHSEKIRPYRFRFDLSSLTHLGASKSISLSIKALLQRNCLT